jgi:hypothetical protein
MTDFEGTVYADGKMSTTSDEGLGTGRLPNMSNVPVKPLAQNGTMEP